MINYFSVLNISLDHGYYSKFAIFHSLVFSVGVDSCTFRSNCLPS